MERPLKFTRYNETYYYVGRPADYFYDFGMIPISSEASNNVLEKNRFLVALMEIFETYEMKSIESDFSEDLILDLKKYFSNYDSFDLSHWNLLNYEKLEKETDNIDFPHLYMSEIQQEQNHKSLNKYFDDILQILKNHSCKINSFEKLLDYYLNHHFVG